MSRDSTITALAIYTILAILAAHFGTNAAFGGVTSANNNTGCSDQNDKLQEYMTDPTAKCTAFAGGGYCTAGGVYDDASQYCKLSCGKCVTSSPRPTQAAPSGPTGVCVDGLADDDISVYKDKRGNTCPMYSAKKLCTPTGDPGSGWKEDWGDLDPVCLDSCCACGGGDRPDDGEETGDDSNAVRPGCQNIMGAAGEPWQDSQGNGCGDYVTKDYCQADGEDGDGWGPEGPGWAKEIPQAALVHCCECGGGTVPAPGCPAKCDSRFDGGDDPDDPDGETGSRAGCADLPTAPGTPWADARGQTCSDYLTKEYCQEDGEDGDKWGEGRRFKEKVLASARTHCCKCGGGTKPAPGCPANCKSRE